MFSACLQPLMSFTTEQQSLLFTCPSSSIYLSTSRINDGYVDCAHGHDEASKPNICALNLPNRFQCVTDEPPRCIPRVFISDYVKNCNDGSDENKFYPCRNVNDYGCKWKRGTITAISHIEFQKICDGFVDYKQDNLTDETDCLTTWVHDCNSSFTRCDGHWHCHDGHDELQCDNFPNYNDKFENDCMAKQQFSCVNRTTRQLVCYSHKLASDGTDDCVGGVDERVNGFCHIT
jgi:hypothetical protein